jgi:heme/copper-type cytochrome/quinol oxidase subunit 2
MMFGSAFDIENDPIPQTDPGIAPSPISQKNNALFVAIAIIVIVLVVLLVFGVTVIITLVRGDDANGLEENNERTLIEQLERPKSPIEEYNARQMK